MAYLPPEELGQLKSILAIVSDPKAYQAKLDELLRIEAVLAEKQQAISDIAEDTRSNLEVAIKDSKAAEKEYKLKSADAEKSLNLYSSQKKELTDLEGVLNNRERILNSKEAELNSKEQDLNTREANTRASEASYLSKEQSLTERSVALSKLEDEVKNKLARLKDVLS